MEKNNTADYEKIEIINDFLNKMIGENKDKSIFSSYYGSFKNLWNKNRYGRLAGGLALSAGAIAATASGAFVLAGGLLAGRAIISAAGGYIASEAIFDIIDKNITKGSIDRILMKIKETQNKDDLKNELKAIYEEIGNKSKEEIIAMIDKAKRRSKTKGFAKKTISIGVGVTLGIIGGTKVAEAISGTGISESTAAVKENVGNILSSDPNISSVKRIDSDALKEIFNDIRNDHPNQGYITLEQTIRRVEGLRDGIQLNESEKLISMNASVSELVHDPQGKVMKAAENLGYIKNGENLEVAARKFSEEKISKIAEEIYRNAPAIPGNQIISEMNPVTMIHEKIPEITKHEIQENRLSNILGTLKKVAIGTAMILGGLLIGKNAIAEKSNDNLNIASIKKTNQNKSSGFNSKNNEDIIKEINAELADKGFSVIKPISNSDTFIMEKPHENVYMNIRNGYKNRKSKILEIGKRILILLGGIFSVKSIIERSQKKKKSNAPCIINVTDINNTTKDQKLITYKDIPSDPVNQTESVPIKSLPDDPSEVPIDKQISKRDKSEDPNIEKDKNATDNKLNFAESINYFISTVSQRFGFRIRQGDFEISETACKLLMTKKTIGGEFAISLDVKDGNEVFNIYWLDHGICKFSSSDVISNGNMDKNRYCQTVFEKIEKLFIEALIKRDDIKNKEYKENFHTAEISIHDIPKIYKQLNEPYIKANGLETGGYWYQSIYDMNDGVLRMKNIQNPILNKEYISTGGSFHIIGDINDPNQFNNRNFQKSFEGDFDEIEQRYLIRLSAGNPEKMSGKVFAFNWHKHPGSLFSPSHGDVGPHGETKFFNHYLPLPVTTFSIVVRKNDYISRCGRLLPNAIEIRGADFGGTDDYIMSYWKVLRKDGTLQYSDSDIFPVNLKIVR
ncbi:MAG: hypothetical protein PHS92_03335 [Candidatus Gracilibacteria bacterium]|nr:hypothetical protein [Candidatus Gracilibacteria bacterium]